MFVFSLTSLKNMLLVSAKKKTCREKLNNRVCIAAGVSAPVGLNVFFCPCECRTETGLETQRTRWDV